LAGTIITSHSAKERDEEREREEKKRILVSRLSHRRKLIIVGAGNPMDGSIIGSRSLSLTDGKSELASHYVLVLDNPPN
jgi:hypothetical protein